MFGGEVECPNLSVETCPDVDMVEWEVGERDFLTNERFLSNIGVGDQNRRAAGHVKSPELERLQSRVTIHGRDHLLAFIVGCDRIDYRYCYS